MSGRVLTVRVNYVVHVYVYNEMVNMRVVRERNGMSVRGWW